MNSGSYTFRSFVVFSGLMLSQFTGFSGKLEKGFEALGMFNYFKANKIFREITEKEHNACAYYGMALMFSRDDNPYTDADSASKYVHLSFNFFRQERAPATISGFTIDSASIIGLAHKVGSNQLKRAGKIGSAEAYNKFLLTNYLADQQTIEEAVTQRDEIEFEHLQRVNRSDSTDFFIVTHPQSRLRKDAINLRERQIFEENTPGKTVNEYKKYLQKHSKSNMAGKAYEELFGIYSRKNDIPGLVSYVKDYKSSPKYIDAWKLLFTLNVKSHSYTELKKFLAEYPEFPLKNTILRELELNKLELFPCEKSDYLGFVDSKGEFVIKPMYDAVLPFSEGLSVVHKNDSAFFINKENVNPFGRGFTDAFNFHNGIAPVKWEKHWYFINRLGQPVSKIYEEINELSNSIYVVKSEGEYGALDQYGQTLIEPRFEKLGVFANDHAYYTEKGLYGFVTRTGNVYKAEFEWISEFSNEYIAVIKTGGKFGLIHSSGKIVLDPSYDQVLSTPYPVYLVVKEEQYGFFSHEGCFIAHVNYDYSKTLKVKEYTDGKWFRLIKKGEHAFVDANGKTITGFGVYEEIHLPQNGLIRVKQKGKYCYLDKKLNMTIACRFAWAEDFADSLALVKVKDMYSMINTAGVDVFYNAIPVERISKNYFYAGGEYKTIYDRKGMVLHTLVKDIQKSKEGLHIIVDANGTVKLLYD